MKDWFSHHRWSLLGGAVVVYLVRLVLDYWHAGALSTLSFVILGAVALFELGCLWYLFRGFREWGDDHRQGLTFEARKAENRQPRKRFGNAPTILP